MKTKYVEVSKDYHEGYQAGLLELLNDPMIIDLRNYKPCLKNSYIEIYEKEKNLGGDNIRITAINFPKPKWEPKEGEWFWDFSINYTRKILTKYDILDSPPFAKLINFEEEKDWTWDDFVKRGYVVDRV